jgi:Zn-finger nucleic acid-binding protein
LKSELDRRIPLTKGLQMGWWQTLQEMLGRDANAGSTERGCPACGSVRLRETRLGDYGSVILDACLRCQGVWADVEDHPFHATAGDHRAANCPQCTVALSPVSPADLPEVIVDRCPKCEGFWLDRGELDRMKDVARRLDADPGTDVGDQKPPGWSALRWHMHQIQAGQH